MKKPILEAHRGFSGRFPENTLRSFREAVAEGARSIELDIHASSDGQLIVMHDETVDRTTNGTGRIADLSLAQLKELDAGAWMGEAFRGTPIPTLDETLELTDASGVAFNVEVKRFGSPEQARKLVALLERHQPAPGAFHVVSSFDADALLQVRAAGGRMPLCILGSKADEILKVAIEHHFEWMHSHFSTVTPSIVAAAHEAGIRVMIWTLNDATRYDEFVAMGVDKICTNWIREMLAAERIAVQLAAEAAGQTPEPPKPL